MRFARRAGSWLVLATLAVAGCSGDDDFDPGVPAQLTLEKSAFTFNALGQNQLFLADVVDGGGNPVDVALSWSSSNPSAVRVNGDGLATAISRGTATITASYGSLSSDAAVTVAPTPGRIFSVAGDLQATAPSRVLPVELEVHVTDSLLYSIGGVDVNFTTTSPGASISPATVTADQFGFARATMTLGDAEGEYTATATVAGTDISVGFTSTARIPGPFDIEVVFTGGNPTPVQVAAFAAAEARWEAIITSDLPDDHATLDAYACGNSPAMDRPIDDLVIFVNLIDIDGSDGVLGRAGVCFVHDVGLLPAIGMMELDVADLNNLDGQGMLIPVITHEMGHLLGYGTLWGETQFGDRGLLAGAIYSGGFEPHFTGTNALAKFDLAGGNVFALAKVPVENTGGPGTQDAHWRESVFDSELMTGFLNYYVDNPLSAVTIASLQDLGYDVDYSKADDFQILALLRSGPSKTLKLHNDIVPGPIKIINKQGKIVGTYRK